MPPALIGISELVGPDVELLHDVHERLAPARALPLLALAENAGPFFLEDGLAPQDAAHVPQLRNAGTTPLAVGKQYADLGRYLPLIEQRAIDFARRRVRPWAA